MRVIFGPKWRNPGNRRWTLNDCMKYLSLFLFPLVLLTSGCPENGDDGLNSEVQFTLTNGNPSFADFLDVPWPSDFQRQDDNENTVDMRAFPNPTSSTLLDTYIETFQLHATGYSGVGSQYFYSPEGIDTATVPQTPKASLQADAISLVKRTPDVRIPAEIKFMKKIYPCKSGHCSSATLGMPPFTNGARGDEKCQK